MSPNMDEAFKALQNNSDVTKSILEKQGAEKAPIIDKAIATAQQPTPAAPAMGKVQKPPQIPAEQLDDAQEWMTAMSVMSGLVGAYARQPASTALKAFSSGMKGYHEGSHQALDDAQKQWEESTKATLDNNKSLQDEYKNILDNRKLTQEEQLSQIQLIAAKYQDQLTYQAAEAKNMILVSKILQSQEAAANRVEIAYEKMKNVKEEKEEGKKPTWDDDAVQAAAQAVANGVPLSKVVPGFGKNNPNRDAVMNAAVKINPNLDIAKAEVGFAGDLSRSRTEGTMEGKMQLASNILDASIPSMLQAAEKVGLSSSTDLNKVYNTLKAHMSDKDFANFSTQLRAVTSDYGVFLGRGRQTVHSDQEALRILNEEMGITSLQGFADAVGTERKNVEEGISRTKNGGSSSGNVPSGVDEDLWKHMTPEERALWQTD